MLRWTRHLSPTYIQPAPSDDEYLTHSAGIYSPACLCGSAQQVFSSSSVTSSEHSPGAMLSCLCSAPFHTCSVLTVLAHFPLTTVVSKGTPRWALLLLGVNSYYKERGEIQSRGLCTEALYHYGINTVNAQFTLQARESTHSLAEV